MAKPLYLLLVGGPEFDDGPLTNELRSGGFEPIVERTASKKAFRGALKMGPWDAVICDFDFKSLNGTDAFSVYREFDLDLPFFFIIDEIDFAAATQFMADGADDFIQRNNLGRLPLALTRELRANRRKISPGDAPGDAPGQLFDAIQTVPAAVALFDAEDRLVLWNEHYDSLLAKSGKLAAGITFGEILKSITLKGGFPDAKGQEDQWIRERLKRRQDRVGPIEIQVWDKWIGVNEHETQDGGTLLFAHDITARKDAEYALRESEARLRGVLDHSPSSILLKGADGRYEAVNAAFEKDFGLSPGQAIGMRADELFSKPLAERIAENDQRVLKGESVSDILVISPADNPNGETRTFQSNRFPIMGMDGRVSAIGVVNTDISEHKRAEAEIRKAYDELENRVAERTRELRDEINDRKSVEAALTKNEAWLRAIIDNSPTAISLKDLDGRFISVNKQWKRRFGGAIEDWLGKTVFEAFPEETASKLTEYDRKVMERMVPVEFESDQLNAYGLPMTDLVVKFPITDPDGALTGIGSASTDISERKRTEEALRWSERDLRGILDNMIDTFFRTDREGRIIMISPSVVDLLGVTPEEVLGLKVSEFVADPGVTRDFADVLEADKDDPINIEIRFRSSRGKDVWALTTARRYRDENGDIAGIEGVAHDITERKETELTLRKLSAAVEQSPASILITDPDGRAEYANPRFLTLTGYDIDEVIGAVTCFLTADETEPERHEDIWRRIQSGKEWRGELRNLKKNGEPYWAATAISPITNSDGEITNFLCVATDTTEKRQLDEQLRQAQKLEAVGTLAGGIAHDFNNILTGVMGHCFIAVEKLDDGHEVQFNLQQIKTASERARNLVSQLLAFSRRKEADMRPVSLHSVVEESKNLLSSSIPSTITINWDVAEDAGTVMVDPTQVHQVLLNLCSNAADAIGDTHGTVNVSVDRIVEERPIEAMGSRLRPGTYARLRIADTGCGMDTYTVDRAFDPFFTTKPVGSGTGLGLAAVHGIVVEHGGGIQLTSTPGKGTTVSIYLPSATSSKTDADQGVQRGFGGTERVLLVDDERMVLQSIGPYLEHFGYEVEALTSGLAALAVFKSMPDHFDIVVTDQIMPGITGDALAQQLREIRSNVPIILCTGYRPPGTDKTLAKAGIDEIVRKPVEPRELASIIRQAIDTRKSTASGD
ncbi:MAG: PAS domain S-box protein [Rhodospirillales bacterium]|nr:PAS domain S-box protein [Rhodospirillales bacterium]